MDAHIVGDLVTDAARATGLSTLDAGHVEGGIVRTKLAVAAVPQKPH